MPRLITLTLSPALDVEYHSETSRSGLNRTYSHAVTAGGKGINVSRAVLKLAEAENREVQLKTVFPAAGDTGELLKKLLEREGFDLCGAVTTSGNTRVNTSLIPDIGSEIEINAPGAALSKEELDEIEKSVLEGVGVGDVVCICGSVPSGVSKSYPSILAKKVKRLGAVAVLDCDGETLLSAAKADEVDAADLIKPNTAELCGLLASLAPEYARFAKDGIRGEGEFKAACRVLPFGSVIMTMAGDGSMHCSGDEVVTARPTPRKVVRLKGAGDTFLGAYVYYRYICGDEVSAAMSKASEVSARYVAGE